MVRDKYRIFNNLLIYSIYYKNKLIWLNIIYEDEKIPLLNYIHFNNNHIKRESMEQKIIEMGYYWYRYSKDIENIIKSCGVYHSENVIKKYLIIQK